MLYIFIKCSFFRINESESKEHLEVCECTEREKGEDYQASWKAGGLERTAKILGKGMMMQKLTAAGLKKVQS